ncbi:MAG: LicD family protein [Clostridiales Family XIII bacterium]|jgi:lipopolysaccharide cholinephosphotransferase|nr:LicD family protein [Clostridiales Family XIII bacterium]
MREEKPDNIDWGLAPLHEKMLEILKYIDEFCGTYRIGYFLLAGTALGAIRHGGFIPWDDDADVTMTVEDYERFRVLFNEHGDKERFYLQEMNRYGGMLTMPKLRMNGTTLIEENYRESDIHQGIYVDIFLLHGAPPTYTGKKLSVFALNYIIIKRLSNNHYNRRKAFMPILAALRLFPKDFLIRTCLKRIYKYGTDDADVLFDTGAFVKSMYPARDIFYPIKRIPFEGICLCVPHKAEEYLEALYGDWKALPDVESIRRAQHAALWDAEKDFREYAPNVRDFSDE